MMDITACHSMFFVFLLITLLNNAIFWNKVWTLLWLQSFFYIFCFFLFYTIDTSVNNNATFSIGKWRQIRAGLHGIFLHFQSSFVAQWTTVCLSNSEACCNNFPDAVSRSSVYYVKKQPAKALIHSGLLGREQHLKQSNLPWHHEDGSATSSPNKEWEIDQFKKKKVTLTGRCVLLTDNSWLLFFFYHFGQLAG